MLRLLGWRPVVGAFAAVAVYALLLLPIAASRNFDWSVFIFAGDQFVKADRLVDPIAVVPNSIGYDGQFYYRIALDPFLFESPAYGVTFDTPPKRMQRIAYPALAWLFSGGDPARAPAALLIVNLVGLIVLAACVVWLTRYRALAGWLPFAIVLWPGFFVSFAFDTAEITTAALALVALAFYLSDRLVAYAVFASVAILTRETVAPTFMGIALFEIYTALRVNWSSIQIKRAILCSALFIPFVVWWGIVSLEWGRAPQSLGSFDLGWPFVGLATKLIANVLGESIGSVILTGNLATRLFVVFVVTTTIAFGSVVIWKMPKILEIPKLKGIAFGWLLTFALMSLLTANGPLIEPISFFRAFSECWVVGCLLLAHLPEMRTQRLVRKLIFALAAIYCYITMWKWIYALQMGLI